MFPYLNHGSSVVPVELLLLLDEPLNQGSSVVPVADELDDEELLEDELLPSTGTLICVLFD